MWEFFNEYKSPQVVVVSIFVEEETRKMESRRLRSVVNGGILNWRDCPSILQQDKGAYSSNIVVDSCRTHWTIVALGAS